ncbi:MAG: type VI secretion system contractile sheath domain-containing protein [Blastocatellia bacterium]
MQPTDSGLEATFTLESEKTGVIEEPPFKILALGDWSGDAETRPLYDRKPIEIDRDNFDEIIERLGVRLDLDFADGSTLPIDFAELDDFHPDALFRRIPLFTELRDLRKRLKDENTFYSAARDARERFGVSTIKESDTVSEPPAAPTDNLLDAILTKPSGGAPPPKPGVSSDLDGLIRDLVSSHLVSVDEIEQVGMLAAVDEATSGLMRAILHHRKFKELEAAWRGLYFLVRRTETSTDLKIFILDISKEELADNLKTANSLEETALYRHLMKEAVEEPGAEPWAVVAGSYAYSPNVDDIAALMRISKIAALANAPFVSHIRPDVIGVHSLYEHADPREWNLSTDTDSGKLWSALRRQAESQFLGMTIPRFLSRLPYGVDTDPLETFSFEEFAEGSEHDNYLWSNPAFIAAQLLAESYSSYGWEMGRFLKQDVEGLPVHLFKEGTETVFKPCSEVLLTDVAFEKLMSFGLMPLVSYKNSDRVKLARFQSIADPVTGLKGRWSL